MLGRGLNYWLIRNSWGCLTTTCWGHRCLHHISCLHSSMSSCWQYIKSSWQSRQVFKSSCSCTAQCPWFQAFFDRNVIQNAQWAHLAKTRLAKEETGERMASSDCSCSTVISNTKFVKLPCIEFPIFASGKILFSFLPMSHRRPYGEFLCHKEQCWFSPFEAPRCWWCQLGCWLLRVWHGPFQTFWWVWNGQLCKVV